jgi:hypothetical protein
LARLAGANREREVAARLYAQSLRQCIRLAAVGQ